MEHSFGTHFLWNLECRSSSCLRPSVNSASSGHCSFEIHSSFRRTREPSRAVVGLDVVQVRVQGRFSVYAIGSPVRCLSVSRSHHAKWVNLFMLGANTVSVVRVTYLFLALIFGLRLGLENDCLKNADVIWSTSGRLLIFGFLKTLSHLKGRLTVGGVTQRRWIWI